MKKSNEQILVENIINFESQLAQAIDYIEENYHVTVDYYDEEDGSLYLIPQDINESNVGSNLVNAQEYVKKTVFNDMCTPLI